VWEKVGVHPYNGMIVCWCPSGHAIKKVCDEFARKCCSSVSRATGWANISHKGSVQRASGSSQGATVQRSKHRRKGRGKGMQHDK
jgi:hypothetical protein